MGRKISAATERLIWRLYDKGLPIQQVAKRAGVSYSTAWMHTEAIAQGFESGNAYRRYLAEKNRKKPANSAFSSFLEERLEELGMSQNQLAKKTRISKQMISYYAQGTFLPPKEKAKKLARGLRVSYGTLDKLIHTK